MLEVVTPDIIKPSWAYQGCILDYDFAKGRYYNCNPWESFTFTRTSAAQAFDSTGKMITFATGEMRRTDLGLLLESSRANVVLWNRDLTNAAWVVGATLSAPLKDQTGIDGVANSASSIVGGAVQATNTLLQTITLGSSARFQSAYVKRLVGSGTIEMTMDNGTNWLPITVTDTINWTRVSIATQTIANPVVGFRIATNGDSIAVDCVQNENGTWWTSPILTTTVTVTRSTDAAPSRGRFYQALNDNAGTVLVQAYQSNNVGGTLARAPATDTYLKLLSTTTFALRANNVQQGTATIGSGNATTGLVKYAIGWDSTGETYSGNGGAAVTSATAYTATGTPTMGTSGSFTDGYISRISIWPTRFAEQSVRALST